MDEAPPRPPIGISHFLLNKLPNRRGRNHPDVKCQKAIRLGPKASGEAINHLVQPKRMPTALRKSPLRGVLGILRARGQFGFPPTMHTDACLGYCAMGYQSSEAAREPCDASRRILFRLDSPIEKGRDASTQIWPIGPKWVVARVARRQRTSPRHRRPPWANTARSGCWARRSGQRMARGQSDAWQRSPTEWIMAVLRDRRRGIGLRAPLNSMRQVTYPHRCCSGEAILSAL